MSYYFDISKTIEQLEGNEWEKPNWDSHVVINSYNLRKKPLKDFSVEDFRFMIGQRIGLKYLLPLALDLLEQEPLAEGDYYEGDLLCVVLRVEKDSWLNPSEVIPKITTIYTKAIMAVSSLNENEQKTILNYLNEAFQIFQGMVGKVNTL